MSFVLDQLDPNLQSLYTQWLDACTAQGLNVRGIQGWRSGDEQNECRAEGLSNAGAGQSPHNCTNSDGTPSSRAFDFGVFGDDGIYITDGTDPRYTQAALAGKNLGLAWGGDWQHPDYDHLEMPAWKTL